VDALKIKLGIAEEKLSLAEELLSHEWGTRRILIEAKENLAVARLELAQAEKDLTLAQRALSACSVKAPFTGYLAVRHKRPHEAANRLDNLFFLLDVSQVYAAVNIKESELAGYKIGAEAVFKDRSGKEYIGKVTKIAPIINPASHTARVYVLIGNKDKALRAGMTGHTRLK
jgi:RND family efflux transporter MFP subunit